MKILVTGANSFLGFHVVKRLNERGIRPRALLPHDVDPKRVAGLQLDVVAGSVEDPQSLRAACEGMDTVLHLAFLVTLGAGAEDQMRRVNVQGTRNLLDAAEACGVAKVVVTGSALAVGVNRQPQALNETADWATHRLDLPYAVIRREAEQEALNRAGDRMSVTVVSPSFTMGPDDYVGAPANQLLRRLSAQRLPISIHIGFGVLDVRDFAEGMILAAERGRPGQRYLLSGHNVLIEKFFAEVADVAGVRPPRWRLPLWLVSVLAMLVEAWSKLTRKAPPITRSVVQIFGRYAWYDTERARTELGWQPRPLRTTLEDTIAWLRQNPRQ